MRWVPLLLIAACAQIEEGKKIGEAVVDGMLRPAFEVWAREQQNDPDLRTLPGDPGHLEEAATSGEQRHYFVKEWDATWVYGSFDVEGEILEGRDVGFYRGPPPYIAGGIELAPVPAILIVEAPPGWALRVEGGRFSHSTGKGDGKPRHFFLEGGRWTVRRKNVFLWFDGKPHAVDLEPLRKTTLRLER